MNQNSYLAEEQRVLALEDEYIAAEINRDETTLCRIIDDRFVFNANNGRVTGKDELIDSILAWNMIGQTITERSVVIEGNTAVVCGTTELRFAHDNAEETTSCLRYTSIYIKKEEQWRYLALHMAKRDTRK